MADETYPNPDFTLDDIDADAFKGADFSGLGQMNIAGNPIPWADVITGRTSNPLPKPDDVPDYLWTPYGEIPAEVAYATRMATGMDFSMIEAPAPAQGKGGKGQPAPLTQDEINAKYFSAPPTPQYYNQSAPVATRFDFGQQDNRYNPYSSYNQNNMGYYGQRFDEIEAELDRFEELLRNYR